MSASRPICLLTVTHYFPSHGGGIERVAGRLTDEFCKQNVVVEWLSADTDPPPEPTWNRTPISVRASNVIERCIQLPYPIWSISALPVLWRAIGKSDVVHVHEHLYFGSILAVCMGRLQGRPVVITQHMGALGLHTRHFTAVYEAAARALGCLIFGLATRIVFISANVRSFFGRDECAKTQLIFNGIDPKRFKAVPDDQRGLLRADLGIDPHRQVILFVGRYVRKKGLRILESLAARSPKPLWVFVGTGPETPSNWSRDNVLDLGRMSTTVFPTSTTRPICSSCRARRRVASGRTGSVGLRTWSPVDGRSPRRLSTGAGLDPGTHHSSDRRRHRRLEARSPRCTCRCEILGGANSAPAVRFSCGPGNAVHRNTCYFSTTSPRSARPRERNDVRTPMPDQEAYRDQYERLWRDLWANTHAGGPMARTRYRLALRWLALGSRKLGENA